MIYGTSLVVVGASVAELIRRVVEGSAERVVDAAFIPRVGVVGRVRPIPIIRAVTLPEYAKGFQRYTLGPTLCG